MVSFCSNIFATKIKIDIYKKVVIWGVGESFSQLIDFLTQAGSEVIGVVDAAPEYFYPLYPIIPNIPRIKEYQISPDIPVVMGFSTKVEKEKKFFRDGLSYCKKHNIRLLHPAAFLLRYPLKYKDRVKSYGFPGSGNGLLQDFLQTFLPMPSSTQQEVFCGSIAYEYMELIQDYIKKCFSVSEPLNVIPSVDNVYIGLFMVSVPPIENIIIANIPIYSFTWSNLVKGHEIPKSSVINFYSERGFKNILIIRHPLDIVLSVMTKKGFLSPDYNYDGLHPEILENPEVHQIFELLTAYYLEILKNKNDLFIIKFEDLSNNPIPTLLKICDYCNISVSEEKIQEWCNKKLFKPLEANSEWYQKHFTGGKSKWQKYFTREWFSYFEKYNLVKISRSLGYTLEKEDIILSSTPSDAKEDSQKIKIAKNKDNLLSLAYLTSFLSIIYDEKHKLVNKEINTRSGFPVYFFECKNYISPEKESDLLDIIDMGHLGCDKMDV